ncbi:hypothetical protein Pfra02_32540 [Pseudomonas fragi]|nr:hypothetical protein Pfra02_32540 [Pseudomonas fragi]
MQSPQNIEAQPTELIALPEVIKITGFKTTKIYDMVNKGAFPKKVRVGPRAVRWVKAEVLGWVNERMAARG